MTLADINETHIGTTVTVEHQGSTVTGPVQEIFDTSVQNAYGKYIERKLLFGQYSGGVTIEGNIFHEDAPGGP